MATNSSRQLIAGTNWRSGAGADQFAGTMASAMEDAFMREWPVVMGGIAPPVSREMRLLFAAIAQGVVNHLVENSEAFTGAWDGNNDIKVHIAKG